MTQGIHFSTMLTGADSALKPATMQADDAAAQSGFGFGAVLGELVQPATNSQSDTALRKLPAGISLLSDASLVLPLQAEGAAALEPDNTALLSDSILYQIALKDKYAPGSGNTTLPAEGTELGADGEPDNVASDGTTDQTEQDASVLTGATPATSARFGKRDIDKGSVVTLENVGRVDRAEPVLPGVDKVLHGGAGDTDGNAIAQQSDDTLASEKAQNIAQAASAGLNSADGRFNVERKTAKDGPVTLVNQGRVERAIPVPPDSDVLQDSNAGGSAALTSNAAVVAGGGADDLALQGVALQQHASAGAGNQTATNTKTDAKSETKTLAEKAAMATQSSAQQPPAQSVLGATTAQQDSTIAVAVVNLSSQEAMRQQLTKTANSKTDKASPALSSVPSSAPASNLATAAVTGSAEQLAQQQQSAAGQADNPAISAELGATVATKTVAEQANSRADSLFSTSLHSAQQRQQNSVTKTATKTPAEQLKQSLNLLQHDAAGQLRERVNLMLRQNIQIAEIRLDPVGLGQMQIKVDMQQDQANVQFIVQQSQAKELLEQQLPRLREMLQQQGIVLGEGSVQQQSQQERQLADRQQRQGGHAGQHADNADSLADDTQTIQVKVGAADRLVDYYA